VSGFTWILSQPFLTLADPTEVHSLDTDFVINIRSLPLKICKKFLPEPRRMGKEKGAVKS